MGIRKGMTAEADNWTQRKEGGSKQNMLAQQDDYTSHVCLSQARWQVIVLCTEMFIANIIVVNI